jgi:hypothetical protein
MPDDFAKAMQERMGKFGLTLNAKKTRLIELAGLRRTNACDADRQTANLRLPGIHALPQHHQ